MTDPRDLYFKMRQRDPELRHLGIPFEGLVWTELDPESYERETKDGEWHLLVEMWDSGELYVNILGPKVNFSRSYPPDAPPIDRSHS